MDTIFIVDDDPDQAELLATALAAPERRVRAFSDPLRALGAFQSEGADLFIVDLSMPWMGGAQVVRAARAQRPDIGIILISGYNRAREVATEGELIFFAKPIPLDALRQCVSDLLAKRPTLGKATPGR